MAASPHPPPSPELVDQLLRAALLSGDPARAAWERAKREQGHIDRAPYRLLPQLYRNLLDLGVDDSDMPRLKGIYRHAWFANQQLLGEAQTLIGDLYDIDTLVLGGAALSSCYYGDPSCRPIETFDVLVHAADAERAVAVLTRPGLRSSNRRPLAQLMRVSNSIAFDAARPRPIALHWSPFWAPVPEQEVWQAAGPFERTLRLDPAHELMRACVGGGPVSPARFRWVQDAVAVVRGGGVDWERLVEQAERWCMSARLARRLDVVRTDFGAPVPPEALERLRRARRPLHERAADSVSRSRVRGGYHVLHWHRYRRLRAVRPEDAGSFRSYWRESLGADDWGAVARRYVERVRA